MRFFTNKFFILILSAVLLYLTSTGFINSDQKLHINSDGSGNMSFHYWTSISSIQTGITGRFEFDEQKVREKFTSSSTKVDKIKVEDIPADSSRHVYLDLTFNDIGKLSESKGFENIKTSWKETSDGMELRIILLKDVSLAGDTNAKDYKLSYEIELPGEIVSTNGKRDGQKVVWEHTASELTKDLPMIIVSKKAKEKDLRYFRVDCCSIIDRSGIFYSEE